MQYNYRSVRCPYCNEVADRTKTVDRKFEFGSPIRTCPNCKQTYFDDFYKEKAIEKYTDTGYQFKPVAIVILIVFLGITIGCLTNKETMPVAIVFGIISLVYLVGFARVAYNFINRKEYHQRQVDLIENYMNSGDNEFRQSVTRLNSKEYLDALRSHGVNVPDYFYERIARNEKKK